MKIRVCGTPGKTVMLFRDLDGRRGVLLNDVQSRGSKAVKGSVVSIRVYGTSAHLEIPACAHCGQVFFVRMRSTEVPWAIELLPVEAPVPSGMEETEL